MGFHYKIEEGRANFVTLTVVDWIDLPAGRQVFLLVKIIKCALLIP